MKTKEVDYIRYFKNAKNDPILGAVLSKQTIQVEKNHKKIPCNAGDF